jgi:hypothetical protein
VLLVRINASQQIIAMQTIYNCYDGENPQSINPSAPADNYVGDGNEARQTALCMACKSVIAAVGQDFFAQAALVGIGLGVLVTLTFLFPPLIPVGFVALGAAALGEVASNAWQDEAAFNDVVCCMYNALKPLALTQENFISGLDDCSFEVGSDQQIIADLVRPNLADPQRWASFVDTLGMAYLAALAGIEDCPCDTGWCHTFDFTVENGGFARTDEERWGEWVSGTGWQSTCEDEPTHNHMWEQLAINRTFASTHLTKITLTYTVEFGVLDENVDDFLWRDTIAPGNRFLSVQCNPSHSPWVWEGDLTTDDFGLVLSAGYRKYSTECPGGKVTLTSMEVCGRGADPF